MTDRTTPYDETYTVDERIDEIVRGEVHLEMLGETEASLQIGDERFVIRAERVRLFIARRGS